MPLLVWRNCRHSLLQAFGSYYFHTLEQFSEQQKKSKKGLADCKILLSVKPEVDLSEAPGASIVPFLQSCERKAKRRYVPPYQRLLLYSLQKGMQLSVCLRLWVGHIALWKCQNLSLDDKWSKAQH